MVIVVVVGNTLQAGRLPGGAPLSGALHTVLVAYVSHGDTFYWDL